MSSEKEAGKQQPRHREGEKRGEKTVLKRAASRMAVIERLCPGKQGAVRGVSKECEADLREMQLGGETWS